MEETSLTKAQFCEMSERFLALLDLSTLIPSASSIPPMIRSLLRTSGLDLDTVDPGRMLLDHVHRALVALNDDQFAYIVTGQVPSDGA